MVELGSKYARKLGHLVHSQRGTMKVVCIPRANHFEG